MLGAIEINALRTRKSLVLAANDQERIEVAPAFPYLGAPLAMVVVEPIEMAGLIGDGSIIGRQAHDQSRKAISRQTRLLCRGHEKRQHPR